MKNYFLSSFLLSISASYPVLSSSLTPSHFDDVSGAAQSQSVCIHVQDVAKIREVYQEPQDFSEEDYLKYPSQAHKNFATGSFQSITERLIAGDVHGFHPRLVLMNVIDALRKGPQHNESPKSFYQDLMRTGFLALYLQRKFTPEELQETDEFCGLLKSIKVNVSIKNKRKTTEKNVLKAYGGFSQIQQNTFTRLTSTYEMQWSDVLNLFSQSDREVVTNCCRGIITYFQEKFSVETDDVLNQKLWENNPGYLKAAAGFGHFTAITKCRTSGAVALNSGDIIDALGCLRLILPFSYPETMFHLGQVYVLLDKEDLGILFYKQAATKNQADKSVIHAQQRLGVLYAQRNDQKNVIAFLKNPAARGDQNSISLIAQAYLKNENIAASDLEIVKNYVKELSSDVPEYVRVKALYYDRLGNIKLAKLFYGMAADKGCVDAMYSLGSIAAEEKDYENAIRHYSNALENNHLKARHNLASLYFNLGRFDEAERVNNEGNDNSSPEYLSTQGLLEYQKQDLDQALRFMQEAERKGDTISTYNIGVIAFVREDYDAAIQAFKRYVEIEPANANYALGNCYGLKNDYEQAAKHFLKAIEAGHNDAHLKLAEAYAAMENYDQAHTSFKAAIELGVKDAELLYWVFLSSLPPQPKGSSLYFDELDEDSEDDGFEESSESDENNLSSKEDDSAEDILSHKISEENIVDSTSSVHQDESDSAKDQLDQVFNEKREKYVAPELSKRMKRLMARAEKAWAREVISCQSKSSKRVLKTYKDVSVSILPKIAAELKQHPLLSKIKGHLSRLANGEKPGQLEKLKGYDNVWSTRLTKGDRLVFHTEWNDDNSLKGAQIISVSGHYKELENVMKSENSFQTLVDF